jgi:hypothetical protein
MSFRLMRARTIEWLPPGWRDFVGRLPVADEDLAASRLWHLIGIRPSAADGQLTDEAIEHYNGLGETNFQVVMDNMRLGAGISGEGVDDATLSRLIQQNPLIVAEFPELLTYLARPDRDLSVDGNAAMRVEEVTHERVRVTFHLSDEPMARRRRQLVLDG